MIVVSDTSPLNYLLLLGVESILPRLFGEVFIPPAVLAGLGRPQTPEEVRKWVSSPPAWLRVQAPVELLAGLDLDAGETEAISLTIELHAALLLIDDRKDRRAAAERGVTTVGTLTLLELAAERGDVDLADALDRLARTNFRASRQLISAALERDAARRSGIAPE